MSTIQHSIRFISVNESIDSHMVKVQQIKEKYDEDVKLLKIMNPGGANKKPRKNKPKSKSSNSNK